MTRRTDRLVARIVEQSREVKARGQPDLDAVCRPRPADGRGLPHASLAEADLVRTSVRPLSALVGVETDGKQVAANQS